MAQAVDHSTRRIRSTAVASLGLPLLAGAALGRLRFAAGRHRRPKDVGRRDPLTAPLDHGALEPPARLPSERELERDQLRAYAADLRESYARELSRIKDLEESYLATVLALAATVSAKDDYTGGHIHRVHRLGILLAGQVAPGDVRDPQMGYGFLLHDIGKLTVPDSILTKPGPLTDEEWQVMRGHPEAGVRILSHVPFLDRVLDVVLHHHEQWDGGGYPHGLAGEQIPLWARIFAIVDTVDAMTSERPYRQALPIPVAIEELERHAGTQFDPGCVAAFRALPLHEVERALRLGDPAPEPLATTGGSR